MQSAVAQWEVPAPAILPDFRAIYEGVFTQPGPEIRPALQVHLLLARSLMLSGQVDQAWQQIDAALQWTQALAPPKAAVASVVDNIDQNRTQIENQLGNLLNLQRADQKRTAFNQYRKNARTIEEQAQLRFTLETRILNLALDSHLADSLLAAYQQELTAPGEHSNLVSLVETSLIPELIFALKENGNTAAAQELQGKWTNQPVSKSTRQAIQQLRNHLAAGEVQQAQLFVRNQAALLSDPLVLLRLSCEMADKATPDVMVEWVNSIPDPVEQELAFRLTAAQLTQRGLIRELWQASGRRNLSATDKCSLTLGLMEGLSTTHIYAEPASAAAE